jgi:hypothetical protein
VDREDSLEACSTWKYGNLDAPQIYIYCINRGRKMVENK